MTTGEIWMLILTAIASAGTLGALIVMIIALNQKSGTVVSPQPLTVEVVKALHERFANKDEFDALVSSNTARHAQLFSKLETVERDARAALGSEVAKINADRARTMERLNEQFTFIRESLSAINTELKLKREDH